MRVGKGEQGARAAEKLRVAEEAVLGTDASDRIKLNTLCMYVLGICDDDRTPDIKQGLSREGVPPDQEKSDGWDQIVGAIKLQQLMCQNI